MPNWVTNNLVITGNSEKVQSVKKQLAQPYSRTTGTFGEGGKYITEVVEICQDFSFWNIVHPEGPARIAYDESVDKPGAMPFWYDWNCNHWGTKWDTDAELIEHADNYLQYRFDTAWSPPAEALTTLSAQYPDLHIELEWEEEQGFGGTLVFQSGEATETESYDIPNSHADMEARGKECDCSWADYRPFSDCIGSNAHLTSVE